MAELASSMSGMLLPNHFEPLDHDSDSDNESIEYGSMQVPFSSLSDTSPRPEIKSTSPNVTVEYLPHMDLKHRTDDSWNRIDSSILTSDSGFTPNSSGFRADLSSSGGFSSCDLSFNSDNSSMNHGESFRTQQLSNHVSNEQSTLDQPATPTKLPETNGVQPDDPLTPTANLKMLLSAMSPEIRNMENKKKKARLFDAMVEAASIGALSPVKEVTVSARKQDTASSSHQHTVSLSDQDTILFPHQEVVSCDQNAASISHHEIVSSDQEIVPTSHQVTVSSSPQEIWSPISLAPTTNSSSGHEPSLMTLSQDESGREDGERNNRKAKSLGLLCQKFLTQYPDFPKDGKAMDISLDQISKDLNVERRRIYDIVNVLESVEMVSRRAKNRYLWHGRTHLHRTLAKLKCLGQRQKFAEQLAVLHSRIEDGTLSMDDTKSPVYGPDRTLGDVAKQPLQDISNFLRSPLESEMKKDGRESWEDDTKRDKTLGVMSQKFIMLFLVCKDRIISLDVAARILKGDQNYQIGENAKFKTKVRRLYDIANILTSLKLIEKIHLSEGRSRKPAFRWIGPDPDTSHVDWSQLPTGTKPTQKHSYFPLPPVNAESWSANPTHKQTSAMVKLPLGKTTPLKSRINWSRNASFSAICEVAEQECRKYSSAPNSPVKTEDGDEHEENTNIPNGRKKEEDFLQEFQALRNKYPGCVSRLFSSYPSPLTPDPMPLTSDSLHHQLSPREAPQVARVEVLSPRIQGSECGSASKGKSQKLVYVQRYVPLLNANTMAAVQASTTPTPDATNPTIITGNRTIVSPNGALVGGPRPAVLSPTPGSVIHLLPMKHENFVNLPHGNDVVSRNAIKTSASSSSLPESSSTQIKSASLPTSNQVVTIIRRSKRAVKLALDKEFEYHPMVKKVKGGDKATEANAQNPPASEPAPEPTKKSTVIVTHSAPLVNFPEGPHPQAHIPAAPHPQEESNVETGQNKKNPEKRSVTQETPLVRNDPKARRASLKHVKRRLTIELDREPSQSAKTTGSHPADVSNKMQRCYSLSELDTRKGNVLQSNGLIVPYLETHGAIQNISRDLFSSQSSADTAKRSGEIVEHGHGSRWVKMKFGGKFGSLKKNEDALADDLSDVKKLEKEGGNEETGQPSAESNSTASADGLMAKTSVSQQAEQKLSDMGAAENLEDCWLSSSYPPPTLSRFPTFLEGRSSRESLRPGSSSRPCSVASIGELDRWLFPGENASPTVKGSQKEKTVSTPWSLSPTVVTSTYSSPPKLTTQASPAGHDVALASPRPVHPQKNSHLDMSPLRSSKDTSAQICPEPLFTSTPKSPKSSRALIRYFNSDLARTDSLMESVSYSGDDTTPNQPIPCPQDWNEDLGKLKPLEGIPLGQQSTPTRKVHGIIPVVHDKDHKCPETSSLQISLSGLGKEPRASATSTAPLETLSLPSYLMCSKAVAASTLPNTSLTIPNKPFVCSANTCIPRPEVINTDSIISTAVETQYEQHAKYLSKDNATVRSPPCMQHAPVLEIETVSSSTVAQGPLVMPRPHLPLNSMQSPVGKPTTTSGLGAGASKVWKPTVRYKLQQVNKNLPTQVTYKADGMTYTLCIRPHLRNPSLAGVTPSTGPGHPAKISPSNLGDTPLSNGSRKVLSQVPHPLQVAHAPLLGHASRCTVHTDPTPVTHVASPPSLSIQMNGVTAHKPSSATNETLSQYQPSTIPCPAVEKVAISDSIPCTRETNSNYFIASG